jgi:hypothetical protein
LLPKPAKNAQHFIDFLQHLFLQVYPHHNLVLVLDNAPFYRSNQVNAFLSLFERFWKHLKDRACAKHP